MNQRLGGKLHMCLKVMHGIIAAFEKWNSQRFADKQTMMDCLSYLMPCVKESLTWKVNTSRY